MLNTAPLSKPLPLSLPPVPRLPLATARAWRNALPWLLGGLAMAALLAQLFQWSGTPLRAQAALLAVGAFAYVGAGLQAGSLGLSLAGAFSLAGFASLAWLGLTEGPALLALGFWLQAAWTLSLGTTLRGLRAPGLPAGWLGLQLGMALACAL